MEGSTTRSAAQSLAAAQAARNSYNQHHPGAAGGGGSSAVVAPYISAGGVGNNGETTVDLDHQQRIRRGHMQGDAEEQHCTLSLFTYYFRNVLGILRIVELVVGIIVISTANAEQCVSGVLCGAPSSPMWYGDLGGQGFVLFVGIIFILGNLALIFYHLLTKPSKKATNFAENIRFGELIYDVVAVVLYIIAASVEAWYASWTTINVKVGPSVINGANTDTTFWNPYRPQWIASTIFAWINVILYAVDAAYMYFFDDGAPSASASSTR